MKKLAPGLVLVRIQRETEEDDDEEYDDPKIKIAYERIRTWQTGGR